MKVLMVSTDIPPEPIGGVGGHVYKLCEYLTELGVDVTLVVPYKHVGLPQFNLPLSEVLTVPHQPLPIPVPSNTFTETISWVHLNASFGVELGKLSKRKCDIIHHHDLFSSPASIAFADATNIPLIASRHIAIDLNEWHLNRIKVQPFLDSPLGDSIRDYIDEVERRMFTRANGIIGLSKESLRLANLQVKQELPNTIYIPNGSDFYKNALPLSTVQELRSSVVSNNEKLIVMAGRLVYLKGGHILIKALQVLGRTDIKVVFIGSGRDENYLKQLVSESKLVDLVSFMGFQPESAVAAWYQAADMVVVPSLKDVFPLVLLEAMALEKPVIATSVGGIPELISDQKNGLLVPPDDEVKLAEAIKELLEKPNLANYLAKNAAITIRKDFSWPEIARRTLDFYNTVLIRAEQNETR